MYSTVKFAGRDRKYVADLVRQLWGGRVRQKSIGGCANSVFLPVINPILFGPQASGTELVEALTDELHANLWRPAASFDDVTEAMDKLEAERSRLELLRMTALLLKYHANLMRRARARMS